MQPLHHIYEVNRPGACGVCGTAPDNLAVHIHEAHDPAGPSHEVRRGLGAAIVVHRPSDNKFLMVSAEAYAGPSVGGPAAQKGRGKCVERS